MDSRGCVLRELEDVKKIKFLSVPPIILLEGTMIEAISSMMSYVMKRGEVSLTLMKQRMEAEAAMAQLLMEATKNIERLNSAGALSASSGSNINIYA